MANISSEPPASRPIYCSPNKPDVKIFAEESFGNLKESAAKILTSGLLGEQYIGLEAGGSDDMLANGEKITQTQSAIVLENLISQFLYNKAADSGQDKGAAK